MKKHHILYYLLIIAFELIIYKSFSQAVNAGTIEAPQTICSGETTAPLTTTISPSGGSGSYALQWQSKLPGGNWGDLPFATTATFFPGAD